MSGEVQEAFLRVGAHHGETNSTERDIELEIYYSFDLIIKSLKYIFLSLFSLSPSSLHLSSGSISEPQSLQGSLQEDEASQDPFHASSPERYHL